MLSKRFEQQVSKATKDQLSEALLALLKPHGISVFGSAKTVEHEVAALIALEKIGYITCDSDEFDLVELLRITKTKARSLLYQKALRNEQSKTDASNKLTKALLTTQILKDGAFYLIEVPDPLTMDRIRKLVRDSGHISDGTFSGSIAKLSEQALIALVEGLISAEQKKVIDKKLKQAGLPDKTIAGLIKTLLSSMGQRVAGEAGEQAVKLLGKEIYNTTQQGWNVLKNYSGQ